MEQKTNKPIYKKWWFWVLLILVIGTIGNIVDPNKFEKKNEPSEASSAVLNDADYIQAAKDAIENGALNKDETLTSVNLDNKTLSIKVDISNVDPSPLTMDDYIWGRTTSITDAVLELTEYKELWEDIVCDFGEAGKISNNKSNIVVTPAGEAFDSANFKIEK